MSHAVPLVPVSHGAGHVGQMGQYRVIGRPGLYGVCVSDGGAHSLVHHPPVGLLISLPESRTGVDIPRGLVLVSLITAVTVTLQSRRAALRNPVDSISSE